MPSPAMPKMTTEATPLIQTVRVGPCPRRYPHQSCRRFFTIAASSLLLAAFFIFSFHLLAPEPHHHPHSHKDHFYALAALNRGSNIDHAHLQAILRDTPSADHAIEWSRYYTSGPHLAGNNFSQAEWTQKKWQGWGIPTTIVSYDVYLNYPLDHGLSLLEKSAGSDSWAVSFNASLAEEALPEDPTSSLDSRIPTFHGYSANGNVTAPFVYVNYGSYQDFENLIQAGVELRGKIAIAKYGALFRGLKVKRCQEVGMVGILIYSDPGDDGEITPENGYQTYPKGPARNPSSVQRGSVLFLSIRPGDPTTPGYPSKPGVPRVPLNDSVPSIPSIPISYLDAIPILRALNGHGPNVSRLGENWQTNLGLRHKGVQYNIGPSPDGVALNLYNKQNYTTTPLWNVIGIINGTIANEVVIVGNHRDSWTASGAADPGSGSAVLNEVVRSVGKAVEAGWKPLRTIVFASWDGEEHGLIGSTEWVEEYLPWVSNASVAYLNVDIAIAGPNFEANAAPLLNQLLRNVTLMVQSPNQTIQGQTVGNIWNGHISTLGSGSDFAAFQDFAGVPSIDISFREASKDPVYQYHSNYDSFHWMSEFGDPGFKYHRAMAQILGLLLGELANKVVIPFTAADYANDLLHYLDTIREKLAGVDADKLARQKRNTSNDATALWNGLNSLHASVEALRVKASELDETAASARRKYESGLPWWNIIGKIKLWMTIAKVNRQYKYLERHFLFDGGLDGRSWFKHVVFAPGLWTGYEGVVFPGLAESIDAKDYKNGIKWVAIIHRCLEEARRSIH